MKKLELLSFCCRSWLACILLLQPVSVAAGPVGRTTSATTDIKMDAQILSYSRSKGLFGGISLKGSVVSPEKSDMEDTYGHGVTAQTVLAASNDRAPTEVRNFAKTLTQYSARRAK